MDKPTIKKGMSKMDVALQWVSYVSKLEPGQVRELFNDEQIAVMGAWFEDNKLLNPPAPTHVKHKMMRCQCGCGEMFLAQFKTRRPLYKNHTHKMRAYRARKAGQK